MSEMVVISGLLRSNPKLNSRILIRRLRELEETGMIRQLEAESSAGTGPLDND